MHSLFCSYLGRFIVLIPKDFFNIFFFFHSKQEHTQKPHSHQSNKGTIILKRLSRIYSCCCSTCMKAMWNWGLGSCFLAPIPVKGSLLFYFACLHFNTLMTYLLYTKAERWFSQLTEPKEMSQSLTQSTVNSTLSVTQNNFWWHRSGLLAGNFAKASGNATNLSYDPANHGQMPQVHHISIPYAELSIHMPRQCENKLTGPGA